MSLLWKPQNGFHSSLEISPRTRDFHIPTAPPYRITKNEADRSRVKQEADNSLVLNTFVHQHVDADGEHVETEFVAPQTEPNQRRQEITFLIR